MCFSHWNRNHPYRETHIIIAVAKTRAGYPGDASLLEERERIFAGEQLAPVVDSCVVIEENLREQMLLLISRCKGRYACPVILWLACANIGKIGQDEYFPSC